MNPKRQEMHVSNLGLILERAHHAINLVQWMGNIVGTGSVEGWKEGRVEISRQGRFNVCK